LLSLLDVVASELGVASIRAFLDSHPAASPLSSMIDYRDAFDQAPRLHPNGRAEWVQQAMCHAANAACQRLSPSRVWRFWKSAALG